MTMIENSYTKPLLFGECRKQGLCDLWRYIRNNRIYHIFFGKSHTPASAGASPQPIFFHHFSTFMRL